MRFGDRVSAGPHIRKRVVAARVGRRRGVHRVPEIVRARERDRHAHDPSLARTGLRAVVVEVAIDRAAQRSRRKLAEVVAGPRRVRRQRDRADDIARRIVHRRPARRARGILSIEETGGLRLGDDVIAGPQIRERIRTRCVRRRRDVHRVAEIIRARERDRRVVNARLARARLHAVVVRVDEDGARERTRRQLAEIISRTRLSARHDDVCNRVADRRVVHGPRRGHAAARRFPAVEQTRGLRFGDRVSAGADVPERVGARGVRRRRGVHQVTEIVGAGERHGHASDARLARAGLRAVVVQILIDRAAQRGRRKLAEVVAGPRRVRRQRDRADDIARRIVHRRPARRARGILSIEETGGLRLGDDIRTGS